MKKLSIWFMVIIITISVVGLFSLSSCKTTTVETTSAETTAAAETTSVETTTSAETTSAGKMTSPDTWQEKTLGLMFPAGVADETLACVYASDLLWGADAKFKLPPTLVQGEYDVNKMIAAGESLIARKFDAAYFWPIDPAAFVPLFKEANDAGMAVASFNSLPEKGCTVAISVGGADYAAGKLTGERIVELLKEKYGEAKGKILELTGIMAMSDAQSRSQGALEVFAQYPGIEVITRICDWDPAKANKAVLDVLAANPDIVAIYSHAGAMTPGYYGAIQEMKMFYPAGDPKHIIYGSINAGPTEIQYVRDGVVDCIGDWNLEQSYGIAVAFLRMAIEKFDYTKELEGKDVLTAEQWKSWGWKAYKEDTFPYTILRGDSGMRLNPSGFLVDKNNADDPKLWGNQDWSQYVGIK